MDELLVTYIDALLLTDLATNVGTGIDVYWINEVHKTTQAAAITHRLCSLAKDIAGAKVGDDTCNTRQQYSSVNFTNCMFLTGRKDIPRMCVMHAMKLVKA